ANNGETPMINANTLARDAKALNKANASFAKRYVSIQTEGHILAVANLIHAATHGGDCKPLNMFFNALNANDKQAFRGSFVSRIRAHLGGVDFAKHSGENSEPIDAEELQAAQKAGKIFGYSSKNGWFVISKDEKPEAPELRKRFIAFAS